MNGMTRISLIFRIGLCAAALTAGSGFGQQAPSPFLTWQEEIRSSEEALLRWPNAVAAASNREFAVVDVYRSRMLIFKDSGPGGWQFERSIDLGAAPHDLVHDGTRYVISLRGSAGIVVTEGSDYQLRRLPLPKNTLPGKMAAEPGGTILVHDLAGGRVLFLDGQGKVARQVRIEGYVTALAATGDGGFVAAFADEGRLRRFGAGGELRMEFPLPAPGASPAWPIGLVLAPGGDIVVVDRHADRILLLEGGGRATGSASRRGWTPGLLHFPAGIDRFPDGRIIVADQGNGRVQIFQPAKKDTSP